MKVYQTNEIRNISLMGNAGCGKTTLAEAMMFEGGLINRRGDVNSKNTVSDYREIEQEQQGSVFSTVLYSEWQGKKINIIDTPGADDFIGGVISAFKVIDTGLIVLNAQNGVEVGSENTFRYSDNFKKPVIFLINHLDHEKTNFEKTLEEAKQKFGNKFVLVQYPVNAGPEFNAVVDLMKMKMFKWKVDGGAAEILDIPASEQDRAAELQNQLIETAAESDESLMEKFFEAGTLDENDLIAGIKKGIINRGMFPALCCSAKKNMGTREVMDFISSVVPNPSEMPADKDSEGNDVKINSSGPVSLFVFKNVIEQHIGEVLLFKVLSGQINEGVDLINATRQSKERLTQLFVACGKTRTKVPSLVAGDIGATVKLKETKVNHTLSEKGVDIKIKPIVFPEPKYRVALKAVNEADDEKVSEILGRMRDEDPTYVIEYSKELKQLIVHGQGEFHLNTLKWHFDNIHKIDIKFLPPKIPYRETITKTAQASYRHKKQSGGAGQFGEVHMVIEPFVEGKPDPSQYKFGDKVTNISVRGKEEIELPWGGKLVYYNCIVGGVIDARFMPAILKGIMEKMEEGPLTGSYARDIRVAVYDGKMHPVDSNEISFKLAGLNAFKQAFKEAGPKIMEPIYDIEVLVPSDRMGDVISDLQGRRAIILGMANERGFEKIMARVPLAEMNKYSTALSSLTNGRAMYSMKFAEYAQVPGELQDQLLKAYEAEQGEE